MIFLQKKKKSSYPFNAAQQLPKSACHNVFKTSGKPQTTCVAAAITRGLTLMSGCSDFTLSFGKHHKHLHKYEVHRRP